MFLQMLLREPLIRTLQPRIFSFFNSGQGYELLEANCALQAEWTINAGHGRNLPGDG
jgi:hypothetical protein